MPKSVRVKIASISLPINLNGSGIMVDNLSLEGIKNVSLIKDDSIKISRSQAWVVQKNSKKLKSSDPILKLDSVSGRIKINLFWYPTPIFLSAKNDNRADVILNLKLNDYIQGVLVGEMPSHWPLEALKAQAIAARSYAYSQLLSRKNEIFHLNANVLDQVYSLQSNLSKEALKAVNETQNEFLFLNQLPLKAYYHSDCGGHTEEPSNVWGVGELKIGTTKDHYCKMRRFEWKYKMAKQRLAQVLGLDALNEDIKIIKSSTGRAEFVEVNGTKISGQDLRQKIGFDKLKSTLFSLTFDENSVTFVGRGYGHGSGLCQWGAKAMALNGKTYLEILRHYYPLAKVSEVFDSKDQSVKL
ncbi:MAG: SpoIID/LytB domain-containing protein [Oligoflexia bacterium]|nr:SpoIID/LytB domain-containing protein [Oligoflexia bacterium]